MSKVPLFIQRCSLMGAAKLERIEEAALRVLEEAGIAVLHEGFLEELKKRGFQVKGNRVLVDRARAREFIEAERERNGNAFAEGAVPPDTEDSTIRVYINRYPLHVHDLDTDQIVPNTTERLIENTKLVDVLADRGVANSPAGCPSNVAPALQPVMQYWVAATYSRQGRNSVDPKSLVTYPYIWEMAEVLGRPRTSLPVYVISPLTVGSESLDAVLAYKDKINSVAVSSMPSYGSTAPANIGDAFAMVAAEIIGPAMFVASVVGLPVTWSIALFPTDFLTLSMPFGAPETLLTKYMACEVDAFFHGTRWTPSNGSLFTLGKLPGPQTCAEKAMLMLINGLLGRRTFAPVGTISLDEVFSAEQMLYDLEIKDHVEVLLRGIEADCDPDRCVEEILETLETRNFMGLDSTLEHCRDAWRPKLFDRGFLGAWLAKDSEDIRPKAHAMVRDLISRHEYHLEDDLQKGIDGILERAKKELS